MLTRSVLSLGTSAIARLSRRCSRVCASAGPAFCLGAGWIAGTAGSLPAVSAAGAGLVNGEPTKKVAVRASPTPTSSRLMRFKIVSLTRATTPSLRSLGFLRLDRNPLYPKSRRLLGLVAKVVFRRRDAHLASHLACSTG